MNQMNYDVKFFLITTFNKIVFKIDPFFNHFFHYLKLNTIMHKSILNYDR